MSQAKRLREVDVHYWLDTNNQLSDSHGPGTYSLRLNTPDNTRDATRAWHEVYDVPPPNDAFLAELSRSERDLVYVGESTNSVYDRLIDHANRNVRQPNLFDAFEPIGMHSVRLGTDAPSEYEYALVLVRDEDCVVWSDGDAYL